MPAPFLAYCNLSQEDLRRIIGIPDVAPRSPYSAFLQTLLSMSESNPTVHVACQAIASAPPTKLLFVGSITASNTTLELAMQTLEAKKDRIVCWLQDLDAEAIEFGEPRFADQVDRDPLRAARAIAQRAGKTAESEVQTGSKRNIAVCYYATWTLEDRSSEAIMILVDQLQFEARELKDTRHEEEDSDDSDRPRIGLNNPFEQMSAYKTLLQESFYESGETQTESHVVFLARLRAEKHRQAVRDAIDDGQLLATDLADAAGKHLGEIKSIAFNSARTQHSLHTRAMLQHDPFFELLRETPFPLRDEDIVSRSPSPDEFKICFNVTYELIDP